MFDETARTHAELRALVEASLRDILSPAELEPAMRYAVFSGGKRMRPMLTVLAAQACGKSVHKALPAACAVELLHTASLIWDDMPCMDNAAERRGLPAVHVAFGEAQATLAALALFNHAYRIFSRERRLAAEAAACIESMIAGQAVDVQGRGEQPSRKTSCLVRLTLTAGAIACGADDADIRVLAVSGEKIGEAYQIYDDFVDGDSASAAGARELLADTTRMLQRQFGACATPLLNAIEAIVSHFEMQGLAA